MIYSLNQEQGGPWTTSLTWETSLNHIWEELWLYQNIDQEREKNLLFENKVVLICKTLSFFAQGCFMPSLVVIGPAVLEKKIFEFRQCIFAIS